MGDPEPAYNIAPYKVFDIPGKRLSLDPLGEVIYPDQEELCLPFARTERTDDVHSPNGERPWGHQVVLCLWLKVGQGTIILILGAFLHVFCVISLDGRPIVADPEDLGGHHLCARVISTCPLMDLSKNILCFLLHDAF